MPEPVPKNRCQVCHSDSEAISLIFLNKRILSFLTAALAPLAPVLREEVENHAAGVRTGLCVETKRRVAAAPGVPQAFDMGDAQDDFSPCCVILDQVCMA